MDGRTADLKKKIMEEYIFEEYWELFSPDPEFGNRRAATRHIWNQCQPDRQRAIIEWLKAGKPRCTRNPYFFVLDFRMRHQQMSYADYYDRYGTTEPRDGWKMANPTGQKVIYVKE